MKKFLISALTLLLVLCFILTGCDFLEIPPINTGSSTGTSTGTDTSTGSGQTTPPVLDDANLPEYEIEGIPSYSGKPYVALNDNQPQFTSQDLTTESYEFYSELDSLGRCQMVIACIGIDLMPTEDRGSISSVTPSGWVQAKYDIVSGKVLYNRCHLIGHQLTGENANKRNLITGTRYLNIDGMLPFENMIADYVKETENHVLFRVTPLFYGNNLVATGVQMEAYSIEDEGEGICFNVFAYNVQPGIAINYLTGESYLAGEVPTPDQSQTQTEIQTSTSGDGSLADDPELNEQTYILNTSSKKYHKPTCSGVTTMKEENKQEYTGTKEELESQGYEACGTCKP